MSSMSTTIIPYSPLRKLPIGIQSFEKLRSEGFLYVDKTALAYRLIKAGNPCFLSRPRRFGKSLLLSTFEAYFEVHWKRKTVTRTPMPCTATRK